MPKTIIYRHRRENLKKCSLTGLENHPDLQFYTYPIDPLPNLSNYCLLTPDGKPLTAEDKGLFLIDATWKLAAIMQKQLPANMPCRSLPAAFQTAYPRRPNPPQGLASIEALYIAHLITKKNINNLLDNYYWKDLFLKKNSLLIKEYLE